MACVERVQQLRPEGQQGGDGGRQGAARAMVVTGHDPRTVEDVQRALDENDVGGTLAGEMPPLHDHGPGAGVGQAPRGAHHAVDIFDGRVGEQARPRECWG